MVQHIRMHIATAIATEHLIQLLTATAIVIQQQLHLDIAILLPQQPLHNNIVVEPHKLLKAFLKEQTTYPNAESVLAHALKDIHLPSAVIHQEQ